MKMSLSFIQISYKQRQRGKEENAWGTSASRLKKPHSFLEKCVGWKARGWGAML